MAGNVCYNWFFVFGLLNRLMAAGGINRFGLISLLTPDKIPVVKRLDNKELNILNIKNLVKLYQQYLVKNKAWLFKNAPRRSVMKIFESRIILTKKPG
jgi:hypothetical protein